MGDQQGTPQGDPTTDPQGTSSTDGTEDPQGSGAAPQGDDLDKVRAESRKWEARAKKDAQALADLKKSLGSMLSPDQVADKDAEIARLQQEARAAALTATRYKVAVAEGLPLELADRLIGTDEDELVADAKKVKELLRPAAPKGTDGKKGSNGGSAKTEKPDLNALLRQRLQAG